MMQAGMRELLFAIYRPMARLCSGTLVERSEVLKRLHRMVVARLRPESVSTDGHRFHLDNTDAMRLSYCDTEPASLAFLKTMVRPGDVIVDVGAHIGYYSLAFARLVGDKGHVFAFEPTPASFALLRKNIATNGYRNVTAIRQAVSSRNGYARFYLSDCSALNRMHSSGSHVGEIEVETVRLDDFFRDYDRPINLVKLDIEGAEPQALCGMEALIQKHRSMAILSEFMPRWLTSAGFGPEDLVHSLEAKGFRLFAFMDAESRPRPVTGADLLRRYPANGEEGTDIWCTRTE